MQFKNKGKYLGIDYGKKRIGIAISDENKIISFPRDYILNEKRTLDIIYNIVCIENVERIIIGYPLTLQSEKTDVTEEVEKFRDKIDLLLKNRGLNIKIDYYDERLTSSIAQHNLFETGKKKEKRKEKGLIDSLAAQIILQDYLDSRKGNN